jgi:hypothetical protein
VATKFYAVSPSALDVGELSRSRIYITGRTEFQEKLEFEAVQFLIYMYIYALYFLMWSGIAKSA